MNLTYRQLLETLQSASDETLNQTVTVYSPANDEFYPVAKTETETETDVLDAGHLTLHLEK